MDSKIGSLRSGTKGKRGVGWHVPPPSLKKKITLYCKNIGILQNTYISFGIKLIDK